jgi:NAD dependent epimerase/dehydratase
VNFTGKRVLVTGAGGFIGSHLAERLVQDGAKVRAMVHYNGGGNQAWLGTSRHRGDMEIVAGDITDYHFVHEAMADCEIVFHLAALIAIPFSYSAPAYYQRVNGEGTLNVLQSARMHSTPRVIHTSTSEVYGTAQYVPIDERHPLQGQSPYSASKIAADKMAEAYFCSFNLPVVTVRPFNTFGPRQSIRAVIPSMILQCLRGSSLKLGHVHPTRDFNFVDNTVDGFLAAAGADTAIGQTINLGTGVEISIADLATKIGAKLGGKPEIETESARLRPAASEVERLLADPSRAKALLGWTPRIDLDAGLDKTIAWLRDNQDRFGEKTFSL